MVSLLIAVILAAVVFDYINGFHDAANAIATSVSTGVLPMRTAVFLAGILNIAGAIVGTAVAKTIASGFVDPAIVTQQMILAALCGGMIWNIITWWLGLPSSSSHALIGGLAGAVIGGAGFGAFKWGALGQKVLVPLVASPTGGFLFAMIFSILLLWIVRRMRPTFVRRTARQLQLVSACSMAFSHGSNDAQKAMGIITLALLAYMHDGHHENLPSWIFPDSEQHVPLWVVWVCALAIGLGTMAGGKRIIKTMGSKMIRITPLDGFAAESSGAAIIMFASHLGLPISTTHCISACILGVGASKRLSAVRWGVAGNIVFAWVLTIPAAGFFAWLSLLAIHAAFPVAN
jgi:PiT family inorganic phosphate transporter